MTSSEGGVGVDVGNLMRQAAYGNKKALEAALLTFRDMLNEQIDINAALERRLAAIEATIGSDGR